MFVKALIDLGGVAILPGGLAAVRCACRTVFRRDCFIIEVGLKRPCHVTIAQAGGSNRPAMNAIPAWTPGCL